eukprot:1145581-Pelagomonas_calceolata.AAC.2
MSSIVVNETDLQQLLVCSNIMLKVPQAQWLMLLLFHVGAGATDAWLLAGAFIVVVAPALDGAYWKTRVVVRLLWRAGKALLLERPQSLQPELQLLHTHRHTHTIECGTNPTGADLTITPSPILWDA